MRKYLQPDVECGREVGVLGVVMARYRSIFASVGVVSAKLNALKFAKATGDIPENVNFAIKTGTLRDFLDNSAVPYDTELTETELKTAEIASAARAYIMLITCTANEREAGKK